MSDDERVTKPFKFVTGMAPLLLLACKIPSAQKINMA